MSVVTFTRGLMSRTKTTPRDAPSVPRTTELERCFRSKLEPAAGRHLRMAVARGKASGMTLLDVTMEIQAALTSLRKGQAFIADEIARLEAFLASGSTNVPLGTQKRRGRPPKAAGLVAPRPVVTSQAKGGPARPRKGPLVVTVGDGTPQKRGPGRPRKNPATDGTASTRRGPGRPPKNPNATSAKKVTGKRDWSPAQREAARKRMQEYWAKRRKG